MSATITHPNEHSTWCDHNWCVSDVDPTVCHQSAESVITFGDHDDELTSWLSCCGDEFGASVEYRSTALHTAEQLEQIAQQFMELAAQIRVVPQVKHQTKGDILWETKGKKPQ